MISTKDKKSPTTMPKRLTENSFTPIKDPKGRVTDFRKDPVSFIQRQLGNSFLQARLKVSQPNDKYEQEADRIANLMMQMPEPEVLRQPEEEEEEELIQSKPLVEQITPLVQRQIEEEEEEELLQTKIETDAQHSVQRQADEEEEEEFTPKELSGQFREVGADVEDRIKAMRGGGQLLPKSTRDLFEQRFGSDFGQVRVHANTESDTLNRKLDARAFTVGQDIFFRQGAYEHSSSSGRELLAHELAHVVQQRNTSSYVGTTLENVNTIFKNEEKEDYPVPEPSFEKIMRTGTTCFFPEFTNPREVAAFNSIEKQLKMDPRDPNMTIELLSRVNVTKPKLKKAFDRVLDQLRLELHYKDKVKEFFQGLMDFTQNLHNSYQNRFMTLAQLLELKDDDVVKILIARLISEGFEAIGEIEHPAAVIIAEALKVVWDTYNLAKAQSSANKVTSSLIDQLTQLDAEFNKAISRIEDNKNIVLLDWCKLQKVGKLTWPASTEEARKELGEGFEINLWKELLPTKWKHMTSSDDPSFHTRIDWLDKYIERHPHYYITYREGEKGWIWKTKGYYITHHWLGSGSYPLTHSTVPRKLAIRLFRTLGISRQDLFENWNLPHQTYIVPRERLGGR